jgi:hypothetical protein
MSRRFDQSDKRPFKSLFKEGYVTEADYIAELLFKRRGEFSKNSLPQSFWNSPKFKNLYVGQIVHINKMLKEYSVAVLIKAVQQAKFALSITNKEIKRLADIFKEEESQRDKILEVKTEEVKKAPSITFGKPNRLGEL